MASGSYFQVPFQPTADPPAYSALLSASYPASSTISTSSSRPQTVPYVAFTPTPLLPAEEHSHQFPAGYGIDQLDQSMSRMSVDRRPEEGQQSALDDRPLREAPGQHRDKPLPSLPGPSSSSHKGRLASGSPGIIDHTYSSARVRAGSSFTTVFSPDIVPFPQSSTRPPPPPQSTHGDGAVDLVPHRRSNWNVRERTAGISSHPLDNAAGAVLVRQHADADHFRAARRVQASSFYDSRPISEYHQSTIAPSNHPSYSPRPISYAEEPARQQRSWSAIVPHPIEPPRHPPRPHQLSSVPTQDGLYAPLSPLPPSLPPPPPPPPPRPPLPPPCLSYPHSAPPAVPSLVPSVTSRSSSASYQTAANHPKWEIAASSAELYPQRCTATAGAPTPSHPSPSTPRARAQSAVPASSSPIASPSRKQRTGSPIGGGSKKRCAGTTKVGRPCANTKAAHKANSGASKVTGLTVAGRGGEGEDGAEWYCHVHTKEILNNKGFYCGEGGRGWIDFDNWLPPGLKDETRVKLMRAMETRPSLSGELGYVYCFEYRGLSTLNSRAFKIGQTSNIARRLDQWGKQCPSHDPDLIGFIPGGEVLEDVSKSRLKGVRRGGGDGGGVEESLLMEKLIHLEIRDLHQGVLIREECSDCKAFHREIFRVPRLVSGREWEEVVVPVLRKWERFVGVVVSEARRGGVETL